ncbi:MAG TPA: hypothetical protein VMT88_07340 [Actinomycetes bacterium]|nr:hypothetical protein [Actinomycetes bacterium]
MNNTAVANVFEQVLTGDEPPQSLDVEQLVRAGKRRYFARRAAAGCGALTVVVIVLLAVPPLLSTNSATPPANQVTDDRSDVIRTFDGYVGNVNLHDEDRQWVARTEAVWGQGLQSRLEEDFDAVRLVSAHVDSSTASADLVGTVGGTDFPLHVAASMPSGSAMSALRSAYVGCHATAGVDCLEQRGIVTGEPYVVALEKVSDTGGESVRLVGVGSDGVTVTLTASEADGQTVPIHVIHGELYSGLPSPYEGLVAPDGFGAAYDNAEDNPLYTGSVSLPGDPSTEPLYEDFRFHAHWHDGQIEGETSCGTFSGSYVLSGTQISVSIDRNTSGDAFNTLCPKGEDAADALESIRRVGIDVTQKGDFHFLDAQMNLVADMYQLG